MAFLPSSPISGTPQYGFTSPTYTVVTDTNPDTNGKQVYVSAVGGTQAGVIPHSVAAPFTLSMFRPKVLKTLAPVNPVTGVLRNVPFNTYKVITRKGVLPLAGQSYKTSVINTSLEIPAGSDLADPANLKAAISIHIGALQQMSAEIGTSTLTGTI